MQEHVDTLINSKCKSLKMYNISSLYPFGYFINCLYLSISSCMLFVHYTSKYLFFFHKFATPSGSLQYYEFKVINKFKIIVPNSRMREPAKCVQWVKDPPLLMIAQTEPKLSPEPRNITGCGQRLDTGFQLPLTLGLTRSIVLRFGRHRCLIQTELLQFKNATTWNTLRRLV